MRRRRMMQKVSRISLCVVVGLLFLALIWKFAGAQLAKKGIVLSNDTAAKTVSETAPEAEDGSGNAGIKKLAETTPPNETPGWQYSSSGWWYATDATTYYVNGWADIDGNQYHFDSNGYMATGWKAIGGKGCYFDDQGVYQPDRNGSMMVALTFDDGPAFDGSTGRILDVLEKYGARATFFMVGTRINDNTKKYLKRELELGCELGNHTYNHDHYGKAVTEADVVKCSDAVYKACGKRPTAFRCPGGNMSSVMQNTAKKEGMIIAYWSVDTEDWKSRNPAQIISQAEHGAYDGSIILMHDIYGSTADAVEKIVPALVKKGYQIVTVSEMIQAKTGKAPQAGQQYIDYKTINNNTH